MIAVKVQTRAQTTVMRSRLRSATVEPGGGAHAAAEHVGEAAALPGVQQDQEDQEQAGGDVDRPTQNFSSVRKMAKPTANGRGRGRPPGQTTSVTSAKWQATG